MPCGSITYQGNPSIFHQKGHLWPWRCCRAVGSWLRLQAEKSRRARRSRGDSSRTFPSLSGRCRALRRRGNGTLRATHVSAVKSGAPPKWLALANGHSDENLWSPGWLNVDPYPDCCSRGLVWFCFAFRDRSCLCFKNSL